MNFQELEDLWNESNQELDNKIMVNPSTVKKVNMRKITSNLAETRWENIIELGVNLWFIGYFKAFCVNNFYTPKFLIPGAFMFGLSILAIILCTYKLFLLSRINRHYPIIKAQRNLALIHYFNRIEINTLYVLIPTFSLAFLIVAAKGLIGVDLYEVGFSFAHYFIGSFIVGVIITIFIKIFPDKKFQETVKYLEELKEMK